MTLSSLAAYTFGDQTNQLLSESQNSSGVGQLALLIHRFIVLDGVEGCGKSTQARLLAKALTQRGCDVVTTHEPGGTPAGERIREVLLDPALSMAALTEVLLFCASRAQHVAKVIRPALEDGKVVVCDRFSASTAAYQGYAGDLGFATFQKLDELATGGLHPDMTIILDLDPQVGIQRRLAETGKVDRIERKPVERQWPVGDIVRLQDREGRWDGFVPMLDWNSYGERDISYVEEKWQVLRKPLGWEDDNGVLLENLETGEHIFIRPHDYHSRVRKGFLQYAEQLGAAATVIDADRSVEEIHIDILRALGIE